MYEDNGEIIKISRENVGNFALTGYEYPETAEDIVESDTVNIAFGKLQKLLNNEVELIESNAKQYENEQSYYCCYKNAEMIIRKTLIK